MRKWLAAFIPIIVTASIASATAKEALVMAGRKILAENNCNGSCHQSHSEDNDPLTLYTRKNRIVKDQAGLIAQINKCIILLNAPIFPEDIESIAAALEHDYYRFNKQ